MCGNTSLFYFIYFLYPYLYKIIKRGVLDMDKNILKNFLYELEKFYQPEHHE